MGFLGILVAMRPLQSLLFDVDPADPVTIGAVMLLLAVIAILAAWIPARRAAQIDPMQALRVD
jgi:ABC-type lipoprotein release transport system permease subunit